MIGLLSLVFANLPCVAIARCEIFSQMPDESPSPDTKVTSAISGSSHELLTFYVFLAAIFGITFSIALGEALLALAALVFVIALFLKKLPARFPRIIWMVVLFVIIAFVATLTGADKAVGLRAMPQLGWWMALPISAVVISSRTRLRQLLQVFALGCGVLSLKILILRSIEAYRLCLKPSSDTSFMDAMTDLGSMTDGQMLMLGIVVTAALVFIAHKEQQRALLKGGLWALFALVCAAEVMNFKRGSLLVTIAVFGLFLVLKTNWRYLVGLAVAVLVVGVLPPVQERFSKLVDEARHGERLAMWFDIAPALMKKHPGGMGYGAMTTNTMPAVAAELNKSRPTDRKVAKIVKRDHLHNNAVQVLVETGWAGLMVYAIWMAWAAWAAVRFALFARGSPVAGQVPSLLPALMLVGLLLNGMVEYNFGDTELLIIYAMIMGSTARRSTE